MPGRNLSTALLGLILLGPSVIGAQAPNVVLIIGDDQAWTDYGFMGHRGIRTPNLDHLADRGLVFTRGYLPTSLCRPSLASIITGLYPHQHGITGNDPWPGFGNRNDPGYLQGNRQLIERMERQQALPRLLDARGFSSFQSGKWWEGGFQRGGFTEGMTHGDPDRGGRHGDAGLVIGREGLQPIADFLERSKDKPFFLWYAPFLPHTPHNPPDRLLARYLPAGDPPEIARYRAMCEWFDETVGDLLRLVQAQRPAGDTLVIYLADNGWIQEVPGQPVPSGWRFQFAPGSKQSPFEGGVRTPIVLHWPGRIEPDRLDTPVTSLDVLPTILHAAGIPVPPGVEGLDLLDRAAVLQRKHVFGEAFTHDLLDINDPVKSLKARWCIEGPWKLIVPHWPNAQDGRVQLYNVVEDPQEERNLASFQPQLTERLYQALDLWWPLSD